MRYNMIAGKYKVSCVGIGGHYSSWDSGPDDQLTYGMWDKEEIKQRQRYIAQAVDGGINYFDSTWRNEADMLFQAIEPLNIREQVFISGMVLGAFNMRTRSGLSCIDYVKDALEYRLHKVPGHYLDSFLLQAPERGYNEKEADEIMEYMEKRKALGDVKCIGISTHKPVDMGRLFADRYDIDVIMCAYNFHHHEIDEAFADYRGPVSFVAMKPLIWQISTYGIPMTSAKYMPDINPDKCRNDIAMHSISWSAHSKMISSTVCSVNSNRDVTELIKAGDLMRPDTKALEEYEKAIVKDRGIPFALSSLKNPDFNNRNIYYAVNSLSKLLGIQNPFKHDKPFDQLPYTIEDVKKHINVIKEVAAEQGYSKYL